MRVKIWAENYQKGPHLLIQMSLGVGQGVTLTGRAGGSRQASGEAALRFVTYKLQVAAAIPETSPRAVHSVCGTSVSHPALGCLAGAHGNAATDRPVMEKLPEAGFRSMPATRGLLLGC